MFVVHGSFPKRHLAQMLSDENASNKPEFIFAMRHFHLVVGVGIEPTLTANLAELGYIKPVVLPITLPYRSLLNVLDLGLHELV